VRRTGVLWGLKALGTPAFMAVFFAAYFFILRHPLGVAYVMPQISLDRWIPFSPAAYPVYVSLWVYVSLPPAILGNLRALLHYGAWMGALCLTCLAVFWLFPTQTPVWDIDWSLYPSLSTIKDMDAAGNAFPSLHVASAVFSALWLDRLLRVLDAPAGWRGLNLVLCIAIAWSTIATRQHVALDVLAGAAIGLAFALASMRATGRSRRPVTL
jgi:membrane-associated phospholipid phosphatase